MLVVTLLRGDNRCTVKLQGRLTGTWIEELRYKAFPATAVEVDLRDVTFVDAEGEKALLWLKRMGATFRGGRVPIKAPGYSLGRVSSRLSTDP
jgi:hypothetical protein